MFPDGPQRGGTCKRPEKIKPIKYDLSSSEYADTGMRGELDDIQGNAVEKFGLDLKRLDEIFCTR